MKSKFVIFGLIVLIGGLGAGCSGCPEKDSDGGKDGNASQIAEPDPIKPGGADSKVPDNKVDIKRNLDDPVSHDLFWEVQIKRMEITKGTLSEIMSIYDKAEKITPEIEGQKRAIQSRDAKLHSQIFTDDNLRFAEIFPQGPEGRDLSRERTRYRIEHTEINSRFTALQKEISSLQRKMMEKEGRAPIRRDPNAVPHRRRPPMPRDRADRPGPDGGKINRPLGPGRRPVRTRPTTAPEPADSQTVEGDTAPRTESPAPETNDGESLDP